MWKKNLRRFIGKLLISLLTIFLVATFNFFLIRFMPGDPLEHLVGEEDYLYLTSAHPEVLEELEVEYGLDGTLWEQYTLILQRLGRTFRLILPAIVLSSLIGIFLGAVAGWREGSRLDRVISRASLIIYSVPGYCLGMLGLMVFCFCLGVVPSGGMSSGGLTGLAYVKDVLWHMALPVGILTLSKSAYVILMMRSSVLDEKKADYALVSRTKGLKNSRILFRHIFPNAALPMVTIITMEVGFIVSGSMMIEQIFNWDGMGLLVYRAIGGNDYPVLQGSLLVLTVCVVLANVLSDLFCALLDPRIKDGIWSE